MHHPSFLLQKEWIDTIRRHAARAEQDKRLHAAQLELIYNQQWFKLLVPAVYGGLELPLPDVVKLEEAISWADGSMGWVVTLCAGAGWFGGFMQPSFAKKIFSDPGVCLAGSGAPTGIAERTNKGYKVNGQWLYASGAPDATIFTANCIITENGFSVNDETGKPLILSFAFLKEEVTLINTWHSMGMIATASNTYKVTDVIVPADRTFRLHSEYAVLNTSLYHYPFLQLAEVTLVANLSGMTVHFIDLAKELFRSKKNRDGKSLIETALINSKLDDIDHRLSAAHTAMYEALDYSWQQCTNVGQIDLTTLLQVSNTSRALALIARESVDSLYPYCGLTAADTCTEINRVWRDLHTASQHSLLVFGSN